jgi:hypothetical protein
MRKKPQQFAVYFKLQKKFKVSNINTLDADA